MTRSTLRVGLLAIIASFSLTSVLACSADGDGPGTGGTAGAPVTSGGGGGTGGSSGGTGGGGTGGIAPCPSGFSPPQGEPCEPGDGFVCSGYIYPFVTVDCNCISGKFSCAL
ncbi:MAG TPA: hypothetical protein VFQ35_18955 [Polyangiaceae bacterium]|nr:hypothetical protein [Polyangiaceae bacterium]